MRKLSVMLLLVISVGFGMVSLPGGMAQAAAVSSLELTLRKAMIPGVDSDTRVVDSGVAIRAYIDKGFVRRKPDQRADYVDYRRVRKPATLFGHKLVVLEEEYLTEFIVCCVNTGIGMVVEKTGSLAELDAFVLANRCSKRTSSEATISLELAGLKPKRGATYVSISCRARDLVN
jgi:hypothetical protein